mmetsp:Transcript_77974/g.215606  ORF Transcript_77974/g.215606 Transcript_77974/m.215606 type:complete len:222 (+) Transcript_77974:1264-1929(+)
MPFAWMKSSTVAAKFDVGFPPPRGACDGRAGPPPPPPPPRMADSASRMRARRAEEGFRAEATPRCMTSSCASGWQFRKASAACSSTRFSSKNLSMRSAMLPPGCLRDGGITAGGGGGGVTKAPFCTSLMRERSTDDGFLALPRPPRSMTAACMLGGNSRSATAACSSMVLLLRKCSTSSSVIERSPSEVCPQYPLPDLSSEPQLLLSPAPPASRGSECCAL